MTVELGEERRYGAAPIFFIALFFILLAPVFWRLTHVRPATIPEAYENADLYQTIYPTFSYGFSRVANGGIPLWNPKQLCGAPFQADPRAGLFQPLNAVFLAAPAARALAAHAFISLFLMGTFFSLFGRSMGLRYTPALLGGVVYALCGASISAISRPAMASVLVWSAFTFWIAREYVTQFRYRTAVLAGVGIALQALSGANALALAMLGLLVSYTVFWSVFPQPSQARWRNGEKTRRFPSLPDRLVGLVIAVAIGLAISAAQWAPTLAAMTRMARPGAFVWNFAAAGQLPLTGKELLGQFLLPRPGLVPHVAYAGLVTLLLAAVALFCRNRWRDAGFFAGALPLLYGLYLWLPKGNAESFPIAALLYPAAFSVSVLAAIGADRLLSPRGAHSPRVRFPALLMVGSAGLLFYASGELSRGYLAAFAALVFPAVLIRVRWMSAASAFLVALLLVVDLGVANTNAFYHPYVNAPACYDSYAASVRAAEEQSMGGRVQIVSGPVDMGMSNALGMLTPLSVAGAPAAALTRDQARWWSLLSGPEESPGQRQMAVVSAQASQPKLLNVMAVHALLVAPGSQSFAGRWEGAGPAIREVRVEGSARLFVNDDALPRAYWAPQWRVAPGVDGALEVLADPGFDPSRSCVLDSSAPGFARVAESLPAVTADPVGLSYRDATCSVTDLAHDQVRVTTRAPQAGVLVLADSFAPGWKARLDGRPCPLARVNGLFRGVALPAGEHEVVFDYDPISFEVGRAVSLASLTLLVCAGVIGLAKAW